MKNKNQNLNQDTKLLRIAILYLVLLNASVFSVIAQQPQSLPTPVNQTINQPEPKNLPQNPNNPTTPKKAVILSFKDTDRMFQLLEGKWIFVEKDCKNAYTVTVSADRKTIKFTYPTPQKYADGTEHKDFTYNVLETGDYYIRAQIEGEKRLTDEGKPVIWDFLFTSIDEFHWHRTDWKGLGVTPPVTRCKEVNLAPNAPLDKPIQAKADEAKNLEEAIKPYIQKAKDTYPQAKKRYLVGLPAKETFFITTRLHDKEGRFEQVFIAVREIKDGIIKGVIWSDIQTVSGYKHGDNYSFPESELIDWTISKPDGSEEGNFVGKFLDIYQP